MDANWARSARDVSSLSRGLAEVAGKGGDQGKRERQVTKFVLRGRFSSMTGRCDNYIRRGGGESGWKQVVFIGEIRQWVTW